MTSSLSGKSCVRFSPEIEYVEYSIYDSPIKVEGSERKKCEKFSKFKLKRDSNLTDVIQGREVAQLSTLPDLICEHIFTSLNKLNSRTLCVCQEVDHLKSDQFEFREDRIAFAKRMATDLDSINKYAEEITKIMDKTKSPLFLFWNPVYENNVAGAVINREKIQWIVEKKEDNAIFHIPKKYPLFVNVSMKSKEYIFITETLREAFFAVEEELHDPKQEIKPGDAAERISVLFKKIMKTRLEVIKKGHCLDIKFFTKIHDINELDLLIESPFIFTPMQEEVCYFFVNMMLCSGLSKVITKMFSRTHVS